MLLSLILPLLLQLVKSSPIGETTTTPSTIPSICYSNCMCTLVQDVRVVVCSAATDFVDADIFLLSFHNANLVNFPSLAGVRSVEHLDLSYNGMRTLPERTTVDLPRSRDKSLARRISGATRCSQKEKSP
jgi:hypothetical protein